jgi:hypothetical protein
MMRLPMVVRANRNDILRIIRLRPRTGRSRDGFQVDFTAKLLKTWLATQLTSA